MSKRIKRTASVGFSGKKSAKSVYQKVKKAGDTRSVQLLEFLLADEVNHVLYGTQWVDELTKNDPERRKRVLAYPEKVLNEHHSVGVKFEETTYERA
jgi:uncharacterized ferritin-like protein (DUF455 family)